MENLNNAYATIIVADILEELDGRSGIEILDLKTEDPETWEELHGTLVGIVEKRLEQATDGMLPTVWIEQLQNLDTLKAYEEGKVAIMTGLLYQNFLPKENK